MFQFRRTFLLALALLFGVAAAQADTDAGSAPLPAVPELLGVWQGRIGPNLLDLEVLVTFRDADGVLVGSIDIPAQFFENGPLEIRSASPDGVVAVIEGIPGDPIFELTRDGETLAGEFRQGGQALETRLERIPAGEAPIGRSRPQEPTPPYPYRADEVSYPSGDLSLAGTLTLPEGDGPFPALVMITGSGPQDRDETLAGHKPFLVIADALTRAGFAVLRSDDRGVGGSGGDLAQADYDDLAGDVLAGVAYLAGRHEIDPARIGLFGHSEGALLAPLAATRSDAVAFTVLMAGPAVPGRDILRLQNRLIFQLGGADDATIDGQLAYLDALFAALDAGDLERAAELTRERVREQFAALPEAQRPGPDQIEAIAEAQADGTATPIFAALIGFDPQPVLRRLTVPTLAFYGNHDIQVPAVQNAGRMSGALRAAGNPDYQVTVFDGLNHLMQPAPTGALDEYGTIETTIAPEVLDSVIAWLSERYLEP